MIPVQLPAASVDTQALAQSLRAARTRVVDRRHRLGTVVVGIADSRDDTSLLGEEAERIYAGRRSRDRLFGGLPIFGEPAWDILLSLFIDWARGRKTSVSVTALSAAIPSTTVLRWIDRLQESGLLERQPDPLDRRRQYVQLTDSGIAAVAAAVAVG